MGGAGGEVAPALAGVVSLKHGLRRSRPWSAARWLLLLLLLLALLPPPPSPWRSPTLLLPSLLRAGIGAGIVTGVDEHGCRTCCDGCTSRRSRVCGAGQPRFRLNCGRCCGRRSTSSCIPRCGSRSSVPRVCAGACAGSTASHAPATWLAESGSKACTGVATNTGAVKTISTNTCVVVWVQNQSRLWLKLRALLCAISPTCMLRGHEEQAGRQLWSLRRRAETTTHNNCTGVTTWMSAVNRGLIGGTLPLQLEEALLQPSHICL